MLNRIIIQVKPILLYPLTPIVLTVLLWLMLTVPALFHAHVMSNLEPYPDGLFYVGKALTFARTGEFVLSYGDSKLVGTVPPLYPLILIPVFFIFQQVPFFLLTNVLLGIGLILTVAFVLKQMEMSPIVIWLALMLLLLHGYFLWLPTLPMAENLALPLFVSMLAMLIQNKRRWWSIVIAVIIALCLVMTKYAYVLSATMFPTILFIQLAIEKKFKQIVWLLGCGSVVVGAGLLWFNYLHIRPWELILSHGFDKKWFTGITYYSFSYWKTNTWFYFSTLVGAPTRFLWYTQPLTSLWISLAGVIGLIMGYKSTKPKVRRAAIMVFIMTVTYFPVFLLFYVYDARYVLPLIPLIIVAAVIVVQSLIDQRKTVAAVLLGSWLIVSSLLSQKVLYKQVIGSNWLGRSQAWQYEAVKHFSNFFSSYPDDRAAVLTALPPYLIALYEQPSYRVLPLTGKQNFIRLQKEVWGKDVVFDRYEVWLKQQLELGTNLYISNAYVGNDRNQQTAFESYFQRFTVIKIQEGCLGGCTLYQLKLKNN